MITGISLAAALLMQPFPAGLLVPDIDDFRFQRIERQKGEKNWPFLAEKGLLGCVWWIDERMVVFVPEGTRVDPALAFVLDVNLIKMAIANIAAENVLAPYASPEELIARIAPFVAQGHMLCKHNEGPVVPGAEL